MVNPNTFIIGAQKAATTSLYNWISQHPNVCAPSSLKDYPFFLKDDFYNKGIESLQSEYLEYGFKNQKIVMQGSVQYMFDIKAIERIHEYNPNSKLICVLREPGKRALSAYKYFKKLNIEKRSFRKALEEEDRRTDNTQQAYFDFTYKAHGLYAQQLNSIFKIFPKKQVLVLLYDNVKLNPESVMDQVFNFLEIDLGHTINYNVLNATGKVRYKLLQDLFFNKNRVRKFVVDKIIDPFLPLHKRTKIRWAFNEWNTKKKPFENEQNDYEEELSILRSYYKKEIDDLEEILNIRLDNWKH